jgi:YbgC/YbaW family acyl-CoA thioester hydrolase
MRFAPPSRFNDAPFSGDSNDAIDDDTQRRCRQGRRMNKAGFRSITRLRVRYAECDAQKVVFNGNYAFYVDVAITEYWRAMALPFEESMVYLDGEQVVRKSTIEFEASALYDDQLELGIRCSRIGNSSLVFTCDIFRGEERLATCELVYVHVGLGTLTPKPVPQELRDVINAFEAGKPMLDVRVGDWATLSADATRIRTEVFVREQKIPAEMEWDEADEACVHACAYNRFGMALGTGRLMEHVPGVAKIGRMAVLQSMRSGGVGRSVLDALMKAGRERGYKEALLHAQMSAAPFYTRAGFVTRGPVFEEAGIPHVEMVRTL